MSWNNAKERKKFEANWEKEEAEFRAAGMTEEQIQSMREFEEEQYNSDRRYHMHTQSLQVCEFNEDDCDESDNSLFKDFMDVLSVEFKPFENNTRYGWIDDIHNETLQSKLKSLSNTDKEILTLLAFENKKQKKIAEIMDIPYRTIKYRIRRIRNILKK